MPTGRIILVVYVEILSTLKCEPNASIFKVLTLFYLKNELFSWKIALNIVKIQILLRRTNWDWDFSKRRRNEALFTSGIPFAISQFFPCIECFHRSTKWKPTQIASVDAYLQNVTVASMLPQPKIHFTISKLNVTFATSGFIPVVSNWAELEY